MTYSANGTFTNADVDALETVLETKVRGAETMTISFVVGVANLSDFNVDYRCHADGGWFTVAGAGTDYTTPNAPVIDASGDLAAAAFGATVHWVRLDVRAVHDVRIQAAGTSSTVAGHFALL